MGGWRFFDRGEVYMTVWRICSCIRSLPIGLSLGTEVGHSASSSQV